MRRTCILVILKLFLVRNVWCTVRVDPLVLISGQGLVRGYKAADGDYSEFLGVPYARVDPEDPFGPAREPTAFNEIIYYAKDGSVKCPQMTNEHKSDDNEDLDCLRLNIYVPFQASSTNPLPVLIWFHGGEFARGSGGDYGVTNLVRHGVVVVTLNYRLGPYGFMCLDIPGVPGNQGLKDQYAALKWIRSHISSFGGNPYNMTVAGQEAGATSVLLHMYSDKERYFKKAIVESGTPQSEGMFVSSDESVAVKIANKLGLNPTDTEKALEFLKDAQHELVTAAAYELNLQLKPCRERSFSGVENFVHNDPFSLTNSKRVRTHVLIGYTIEEPLLLSSDYFDSDPFYAKLKNNFNISEEVLEKTANIVRQFYIGDKPVSEEVARELKMFESDFIYNHPTERQINQLLKENLSEIYHYLFSYVGSDKAGGHSSEVNYLFNVKGTSNNKEDQLIVDRITTLWTNFVKYGNPTPATTDLIPLTWSPVSDGDRPTMVIDTDIRLEGRVYRERMAFWDLFYSMYGNDAKLIRNCSDNPYICC